MPVSVCITLFTQLEVKKKKKKSRQLFFSQAGELKPNNSEQNNKNVKGGHIVLHGTLIQSWLDSLKICLWVPVLVSLVLQAFSRDCFSLPAAHLLLEVLME